MERHCAWFATLAAAVGLALSISPVSAAEAQTLRLTEIVAQARSQSPQLRAAREQARAMAAAPARVSAYDDPRLSYEAWNAPDSGNLARADNNIVRLSQAVPFPGKRRLAGAAAERDAAASRASSDGVEIEVVAAAKRAFYDLWHMQQEEEIYGRDRELVQGLAASAAQRYAVGAVSQADALRAHVELTRLLNRVTTASLAVESARAELAGILSVRREDLPGRAETLPPPPLPNDLEPLVERALRERPDLAAKRAAVDRETKAVALARLDYFPDFEVSVGRFVNYRDADGIGAMASVSLPLATLGKRRAALEEAGARRSSAEADLRRGEDMARREVTQAFLSARTALLQRELLVSTHVAQAEQSLRASEIGYQTGRVDFLSLVDSLRALEAVHLEHVQAEANLGKAHADLERASGAELSREVKNP